MCIWESFFGKSNSSISSPKMNCNYVLQTPKMHCYNFIIIHRNETQGHREGALHIEKFHRNKSHPHPLQRAIYRITCTLLLRVGTETEKSRCIYRYILVCHTIIDNLIQPTEQYSVFRLRKVVGTFLLPTISEGLTNFKSREHPSSFL